MGRGWAAVTALWDRLLSPGPCWPPCACCIVPLCPGSVTGDRILFPAVSGRRVGTQLLWGAHRAVLQEHCCLQQTVGGSWSWSSGAALRALCSAGEGQTASRAAGKGSPCPGAGSGTAVQLGGPCRAGMAWHRQGAAGTPPWGLGTCLGAAFTHLGSSLLKLHLWSLNVFVFVCKATGVFVIS